MSNQVLCPICKKKYYDPNRFTECYDCSKKKRGDRSRGGQFQSGGLPRECVFNSFLNDAGLPRREIYIEAADTAANIFGNAKVKLTQGQIRQAFQMLKSMEQRVKAERNINPEIVFNSYYQFARQIEYQLKRNLIHEEFAEFVRNQTDTDTISFDEFKVFV